MLVHGGGHSPGKAIKGPVKLFFLTSLPQRETIHAFPARPISFSRAAQRSLGSADAATMKQLWRRRPPAERYRGELFGPRSDQRARFPA